MQINLVVRSVKEHNDFSMRLDQVIHDLTQSHNSRKTMYVYLKKSCIIKKSGHYSYLSDVYTKCSMTFDENGSLWLSKFSYTPQKIDNLINELFSLYEDVTYDSFRNDFIEFVDELILNGFVDTMQIPSCTNLYIELTQICNERCIHCYIPDIHKGATGFSLRFDRIKSVISDFKEIGGKEVIFTGGEIGLYDHLFDLIEFSKNKGLCVTLLTNATLFSEKEVIKLKELETDKIQVSLYSIHEKSHDEITSISGSFKKTMNAIKLMKKHNLQVDVACVVLEKNMNDIIEMIYFFKDMGITVDIELNILAQRNKSKSNLCSRLTLQEYQLLIEKLLDSNLKEYIRRDNIAFDEKFNLAEYMQKPLCQATHISIFIDAKGNVIPCAGLSDIIFGNIYTNSLSNIWYNSTEINNFRLIREKDLPNCVSCEFSNFCLRCMARNYSECGDLLRISNIFCDQARIVSKLYHN